MSYTKRIEGREIEGETDRDGERGEREGWREMEEEGRGRNGEGRGRDGKREREKYTKKGLLHLNCNRTTDHSVVWISCRSVYNFRPK